MMTHRRNEHVPWAVCGEETFIYAPDDEAPTCLGCAAGRWTALDNEQMRYINYVSSQLPSALAIPAEYLYGTTYTSNTLALDPRLAVTS